MSPFSEWSVAKASLLCWLRPATAARHSHHVRLRWAFASHAVAALAGLALSLLIAGWDYAEHFGGAWDGAVLVLGELLGEASRYPLEACAVTVGVIAAVESGYLIAALLLMSWGAVDEPVRRSFANALRRLWLHTWHALIVCILLAPPSVTLGIAQSRWWQANRPVLSNPPSPPTTLVIGSQAWQDYQEAQAQYYSQRARAWTQVQGRRPWYVRYGHVFLAHPGFICWAWVLWALLRAIGADRPVPPATRPPTCETCGYDLTAAKMDGRCPECGDAVVASLGPNVRPGTPWQHRSEVGRRHAWRQCCTEAVFHPREFGRKLRTISSGTDHRTFFALHLVPIFLIAAVGILLCYIVDPNTLRSPFDWDTQIAWLVAPAAGYTTVTAALFAAMLTAGLGGAEYAIGQKRNLMGAAMQAASYLAGYLVLWALFAAVLGVIVFALKNWFDGLQSVVLIDDEILMFLAWFVPNVLCLLYYVLLVRRVTDAARYANR